MKRQCGDGCEKRGKWINSRNILKAELSGPYDGLMTGAVHREE